MHGARPREERGDDARSEVILDASNNIILASCTQSANFPVRGASFNPGGGFGCGVQDGVVLKFNSNLSNALVFYMPQNGCLRVMDPSRGHADIYDNIADDFTQAILLSDPYISSCTL